MEPKVKGGKDEDKDDSNDKDEKTSHWWQDQEGTSCISPQFHIIFDDKFEMRRSLLRKVCYDQTQTFTYCEKKGHTKANCWKKNLNKVPKYINAALTIAISMQRRMLQQTQIQHQCQLTKRFVTCVIEKISHLRFVRQPFIQSHAHISWQWE